MTLNVFNLFLLLLPVAALSGWLIGRRHGYGAGSRPVSVNRDYLKGLSYLVNEDSDKAIEVFTRLLEVDNETVETHLALGNLFRRQGEVDRALKIHQNLVARPSLEPGHRNQACYELAQDYLRAGVLDRAEDLFEDLANQGIFLQRSLQGLVSIYEQERDWERAIEACRRLEAVAGHSLRPVIAQYYCEMANDKANRGDLEAAQGWLKRALAEHPDCVRASIMQGNLEEKNTNYRQAIKAYQRVVKQDIEFVGEVLEPLERCYLEMGDLPGLQEQLRQIIKRFDGAEPRVAMARLLMREGDQRAAIEYMADYLQENPSWLGFHFLLELAEGSITGSSATTFESLRAALGGMMAAGPRFQCGNCGFAGPSLHWQCLRCKHWNTLSPIKDVTPLTRDAAYVPPAA